MKPIFRNAMFGFHKEDVTKFIASQSKVQEKLILDLKNERDQMLRNYEDQIQKLQLDADELEHLREHHERIERFSEMFSQWETKSQAAVSRLEEHLNESVSAVAELEKNNSELAERLKKESVYREKARRFDQLSSVLSGIVNGKTPDMDVTNNDTEDSTDFVASPAEPVDLALLREEIQNFTALHQDLLNAISRLLEQ